MIDDQALLRAYLETKDESAFTELVRRHLSMVHAAAMRRLGGDEHHAADVAQQVFVALVRDASRLTHHPSLAAWLYAATRNIAISLVRAERRRRQREMDVTMPSDPETAPTWDHLRPLVDTVMDSLPERDRAAVLLHYFQGLGFRDVGQLLGLSEDAARKRAHRALERLRVRLGRARISSTSAALATLLTSHSAPAASPALASQVLATAIAAGNSITLGTLAASTLAIMSPLKITAAITTATAILAVGWSLLERNAAQVAQRELASLRQSAAVPKPSLPSPPQLPAAPAAADSSPYTDTPPSAKPEHQDSLTLAEYRRLQRVSTRAGIDPLFGAFFRLHGYSAVKIDRIKDLMVEGTDLIQDIGAAARILQTETGKRPSPTTLREAAAKVAAAEEEQMKALLGADDFAAWKAYAKTARLREITNELAVMTYAGSAPLTAEQTERLVQVLASSGRSGASASSPEEIDWHTASQQVGSVLSPAQQQALEQIGARREAQRKLRNAMPR